MTSSIPSLALSIIIAYAQKLWYLTVGCHCQVPFENAAKWPLWVLLLVYWFSHTNTPCNFCLVNGQQMAIFIFIVKPCLHLHKNLSWPLNTHDGGRLEFSLRLQSSLTCGPLHMCPPSNHLNTSGCKLSVKIHQKVIFYNTMVFLCLLVGFVGQAIGAGIPEKLENEICKNSKSGICNLRASWGYLASNGPVQDLFFF